MAEEIRKSQSNAATPNPGPFLAKVVSHLDPTNMGSLEVELLKEVGSNTSSNGQYHQVRYLSPFFGSTSVDYISPDPNDYNNTQKSYGMWMIPPDVGTIVMVIFVEGDTKKGYWIGCVPDGNMNFMVPGYASTKFAVGSNGTDRVPVAEYNKKAQKNTTDGNHFQKPVHPFKSILETQGLLKDDIRGITTSSARREVPSSVFGISTPGPIDKSTNAKKGAVGKVLSKIANAFVSRLGGSSFVMDDGDDKFLRKGHASTSGPVYAAVEQGETGGNVGIPHNELVRIRTRTGHQILLHNSEDLIYIGNSRGTTWIELTSNGKIDIFAEDSVSIHTKNDFNVTADRDINFNAIGGSINFNAKGNINNTASGNVNIKSTGTSNIQGSTINLKGNVVSGDITGKITCAVQSSVAGSTGSVNIQSGSPAAAAPAAVPVRVPQHEPWNGHENLSPTDYTKDKTLAKPTSVPLQNPPMFQQYTTKVDTFEKIAPPAKK